MDKFNNCIYILSHDTAYFYNNKNSYKIGSTCNMKARMLSYKTYYPIDKNVLGYFYIKKYNCYTLDDDIKIFFNDHRIKDNAGIEFYQDINIEDIKKYFDQRLIEYAYYTDNEYEDIKNENINDLKNDIIKDITFEFTKIINKPNIEQINVIINKPNTEQVNVIPDEIINKPNTEQINVIPNEIILRTWQKELIDSYKKFMLDDNNKSALVIAPTGCGKSFMIRYLMLFEYILTYHNDIILLNKNKEIFDDTFINVTNKLITKYNLPIRLYNLINDIISNYSIFDNKTKMNNIYIVNNDKFITSNRYLDYTKYSWGKIKLLILDECHWSGANLFYNFLSFMKDKIVDKIIGFSATPVRIMESNHQHTLDIFRNELTNDFNVIYTRSYFDSINEKDRVLTKWLLIPIKINELVDDVNVDYDDTNTNIKSLNEIGIKSTLQWLNKFIVKSLNRKGILWFGSINGLTHFYDIVTKNKYNYDNLTNISFYPTHSKLTDNNIPIFKSKNNNAILLSVRRATEGFDDPSIDFGFDFYIKSLPNALLDSQKEGRASRIFKGKEISYFGFINSVENLDYEQNLIKRLGNWISYVDEFKQNKNASSLTCNKNTNMNMNYDIDEYINMMIDDNIKEIEYKNIRDKIIVYIDNINPSSTITQIHKHMQKINRLNIKANTYIIDTETKYKIYAEKRNLPINLDLKDYSYNWVRFLRPDYNIYVNNFYNINDLKNLLIKNYDDYVIKSLVDKKIPSIELINNGIYNTNNEHFNPETIYNIIKRKKF